MNRFCFSKKQFLFITSLVLQFLQCSPSDSVAKAISCSMATSYAHFAGFGRAVLSFESIRGGGGCLSIPGGRKRTLPKKLKDQEHQIIEDLESEYPTLELARLRLSVVNHSRHSTDHTASTTNAADLSQEPGPDPCSPDDESSSASSCDATAIAAAAAEDCAYGPHSRVLGDLATRFRFMFSIRAPSGMLG